MIILKRTGKEQQFDGTKIQSAVRKVFSATGTLMTEGLDSFIAQDIEEYYKKQDVVPTVEDIQDMVEDKLINNGYLKEAKAYIRYRQDRTKVREEGWRMDDLQFSIWSNKYRYDEETFDEWVERVSGGDSEVAKLIRDKKFLFGGRILAHRGLPAKGKKVVFSNCYVLPKPEDNIESIFDTARDMAKTYAMGGGIGISLEKLRPRGMAVNNSAKTTTGAVSFMELYDLTTGLIGGNGRRGALMLSIPVSHPDSEEFIDIKTKNGSITKANISLMVDDAFMEAVKSDSEYSLHWEDEEGRSIEKTIRARDLFDKNVKNNWDWAEAGFLFWDTIDKWHLMSEVEDYELAGTNPCGELPLVGGGSCLLGSLNLSEFVLNPFTKEATFDEESFKKAVKIAVRGLNDVLDEGENLHPLEAQRESVKDYRQIGLGIMGFADFLIKMGIKYGDEESIKQSTTISNIMSREAIKQSALLARERGSFRKFDLESILDSPYLQRNADDVTIGLIKEYGLRNSQILAIAPTGSLSTLLGISGGIEPIFAKEFTRKTESVHNEDVYYKVYTPIVKEVLEKVGYIPNYVVTSHDIDSSSRVKIQATWQQAIDSAISSTINLPKETTPEMVGELFIKAWQEGLKGVTIFRDGCKRAGILTLEDDIEEPAEEKEIPKEADKYQICSECGEKIEVIQNGCTICMNCGHSPC